MERCSPVQWMRYVYRVLLSLQETLYVKDTHATGNSAWRLRYGTKQAAHNSNHDLLKGLGFQQCKDDTGLYFRIANGSIIWIYIDDLLCAFHSRSAMIIWKKATSHHVMTAEIPRNGHWVEQQHGPPITGAPAIRALAPKQPLPRT